MRKSLVLSLLILALVLLTACGGEQPSSGSGSGADYFNVIENARSQEENTAYPIFTSNEGDGAALIAFLGAPTEKLTRYAVSASLINVKAYGIGIFLPKEGAAQEVLDAANLFVEAQQKAQENYLPDQYAIAKAAIVKQVPSGEILMVMCENAQEVAAAIEKALKT